MTVLEAALKVLQQAGEPLHYREITEGILKAKLWTTTGKTPEATVNAQLAVDAKTKGAASVFRRVGRGVYSLNEAHTDPIPRSDYILRAEDHVLYVDGPTVGETLSFTEAAHRILKSVNGKPMHYREITRHALDHKMLDTKGKTPEATMYAQILTECKRRQGRGEQQRFLILGKGMVGLAKRQALGLWFQIDESNRKARKELLKLLKEMPPGDFEDVIGRLLATIGFEEVEVTDRNKDGGIDVRGTLVVGGVIKTRLAVQVKRWRTNILSPIVQQVRGSLGAHEQGLIITTSDFSKGAREEAERVDAMPVALMNGEQLVALMVENEVGVRRTPVQLIEVGELLIPSENVTS
ncbi:MAG: restriction endonuclease [Kiritimatiellae bacterium]|jgi:restriction system protein|nr:restriction endonuclease [Kiritimatiellia bacterium]